MTYLARYIALTAATAAIGVGLSAAQTVTLTPQDRATVVKACESGQDILPIAYDNGAPDGMFAVPILDADGEAISAIMLTRRIISTLPQCELSMPVQGFAGETDATSETGDSA